MTPSALRSTTRHSVLSQTGRKWTGSWLTSVFVPLGDDVASQAINTIAAIDIGMCQYRASYLYCVHFGSDHFVTCFTMIADGSSSCVRQTSSLTAVLVQREALRDFCVAIDRNACIRLYIDQQQCRPIQAHPGQSVAMTTRTTPSLAYMSDIAWLIAMNRELLHTNKFRSCNCFIIFYIIRYGLGLLLELLHLRICGTVQVLYHYY